MIYSVKKDVVGFIKHCDTITLIFAVIMMCRLTGFIGVPSPLIYVSFILYSVYIITRGGFKMYMPLILFLIYIPIQLVIVNPNPMFKSWERFTLFSLMLICVSPLIINKTDINYRHQIFTISIFVCTILAIGSFFARFLGINFMTRTPIDYITNVGYFGGLMNHSMTLGIVAAVASVYCAYSAMIEQDKKHKKLFYILTIFCLGSVLFSSSRSALVAAVGGVTITIYRLSGSSSKFIKTLAAIVVLGSVCFPLWNNALDGIIRKNEGNLAAGSAYSSRNALWEARCEEFKRNPILGVGFSAIDLNLVTQVGSYSSSTGQVESGSSWLTILSMTGCIGSIIIIPMLISLYINVYRRRVIHNCLICGVLTVFYIHMLAEGYLFYGGSPEGFILWSTIAAAHDSSC